jgi:hypothetical protein
LKQRKFIRSKKEYFTINKSRGTECHVRPSSKSFRNAANLKQYFVSTGAGDMPFNPASYCLRQATFNNNDYMVLDIG